MELSCLWPTFAAGQNLQQDLYGIISPLQNVFQRCGGSQAHLQAKLDQIRKDNAELERRGQSLREELAQLEADYGNDMRLAALLQPQDETPQEKSPSFELFEPESQEIKVHSQNVHCVAMDPNSSYFATASWDGSIQFCDLDTLESAKVFNELPGSDGQQKMSGLYAVAFAKSKPNIFGCTSADHSVYLWNFGTGEHLKTLSKHTNEVNGIAFHPVQDVMCSCSDDQTCIVWDFAAGEQIRTLDKHDGEVYGACFFADKEYTCATVCFDQITRIWDLRDKALVAKVKAHNDDVIGIDYCESRQLLATSSDDGCIYIQDARVWKTFRIIDTKVKIEGNEVKRISWSPCGKYLAAGCAQDCAVVYDISGNWDNAQILSGHTDTVFDVAWGTHPTTKKSVLVSASHDSTSRIWQAAA